MNTAILVSSSFTVHYALESIRRGNRAGLKLGLVATWLLGATFLFIQINEYVHLGLQRPRPLASARSSTASPASTEPTSSSA